MSRRSPDSRHESAQQLAVGLGEAARVVGLGRTTLWRHLRAGTGPKVIEVGRKRVIRLSALNEWLAQMEQRAITPMPPKRKGARP